MPLPNSCVRLRLSGIVAFKLYPAGATTNPDSGVTDLFKLIPVLEEMAKQGILFLVHGEVTDSEIDIFDREAAFIEHVMKPVLAQVPNLKVVFEHITTAEAARLVLEAGDNVAASVTPQHLLLTATTFWSAAYALIISACRFSNAKPTVRLWLPPLPVIRRTNSSSARILHHMPKLPKKMLAVVPVCSAR